jgi:hypothetical protein
LKNMRFESGEVASLLAPEESVTWEVASRALPGRRERSERLVCSSALAIEEALGRDATLVIPAALRTRRLTVRLPRYQIGALRVLAGDGRESGGSRWTRC